MSIPKVKYESEIDLKGQKIKVYVLEDGRRIIDVEDFEKCLSFLGLTKDDLENVLNT